MKYIVITIVAVLTFCACQKEDALTNELDFSNVFEITNNPNDAVQSARYEIYSKYNVSVYFNDTVGRQLIRNDIYGNPYYRYETLDMPWTFFSENSTESNVTYTYFYTEGEERQLKVLERISAFLEDLNEKMRPSIIMAVDSAYLVRTDGVVTSIMGHLDVSQGQYIFNKSFRTNFRYMLITSLGDISDEEADNFFLEITRDLAVSKIVNFADKLAEFGTITPDNYKLNGIFSQPTDDEMEAETGVTNYSAYYVDYGRRDAMFDVAYAERIASYGLPETFVETSRLKYASIFGPWGFVMAEGSDGLTYNNAPNTVDEDITAFTQLALLYTPEEVQYYWGSYPLVMQKYNIIKDILVNEMGIDLETE